MDDKNLAQEFVAGADELARDVVSGADDFFRSLVGGNTPSIEERTVTALEEIAKNSKK